MPQGEEGQVGKEGPECVASVGVLINIVAGGLAILCVPVNAVGWVRMDKVEGRNVLISQKLLERVKKEISKKSFPIEEMFTLRFDGGAQPNPGRGAGAYWIETPDGKTLEEGGVYLEHCTNNIAEYSGLIQGVKACLRLGITAVQIESDSMLVVCQITGKWKVSHPNIKPVWKESMELLGQLKEYKVSHILRHLNQKADRLSDETIENKVTWCRSSL
jgi:ribonuclease HI